MTNIVSARKRARPGCDNYGVLPVRLSVCLSGPCALVQQTQELDVGVAPVAYRDLESPAIRRVAPDASVAGEHGGASQGKGFGQARLPSGDPRLGRPHPGAEGGAGPLRKEIGLPPLHRS